MAQETNDGSSASLQLAVAIAFVKNKRQRDLQCEQLKGRVGQLEEELKRVKATTLVVADALRKNQSTTHEAVSSLLLSEGRAPAAGPSPACKDASTICVAALTDNLKALLQGLHMLQLASVMQTEHVHSWANSPTHEIICTYMTNTLLHQPPSELRRAYIKACAKMLESLSSSRSASAQEISAESVSSGVLQMITGLVRTVTGSGGSNSQACGTEQPALAILTETACAGPGIGQLLLLACADELQAAATTLAACTALVKGGGKGNGNLRMKLCSAAALAPRCVAIMELLTCCTSRLSTWCKPVCNNTLEGRAAPGTAGAAVMDGSIIQAAAASCAAALTQAAHLAPFYSLFAAALTDALAALGAALQFVALDRQFADSPCREACRASCQTLKSVFMPPMQ
ncbi:MAG: hypothetical protein WDW38_008863 [Sanguina aurantia]